MKRKNTRKCENINAQKKKKASAKDEKHREINADETQALSAPSTSSGRVSSEKSDTNIRILSVPSKLSELVMLQHPASATVHGYVKVTVWCGSIHILGYNVKEGENIFAFSTEGTGLKKIVTTRPKHKLDIEILEKRLEKLTCLEKNLNLEAFMDDVGLLSVVICVEKVLLPVPLRILQLYYPTALQTTWVESETSEKENNLKLCSTEQAYTINLNDDFNILSREITAIIQRQGTWIEKSRTFRPTIITYKSDKKTRMQCITCMEDFKDLSFEEMRYQYFQGKSHLQKSKDNTESEARILVRGEKNMGKSTLIRYLMNSSLNNVDEVYFLDTDPGQTEFTPPGVVSLHRVTNPLLGPPFTHQQKPLKMIFIGSVTPGTCPTLYEESIKQLMKYFNEKILKSCGETQKMDDKIQKKPLFVNTIGWVQGVGEICLQKIKNIVKPTVDIEIVTGQAKDSIIKTENDGETIFKLPSKAPSRKSRKHYFSSVQLRNFSIVAYFGLCQEPSLPPTMINSFHPVCVSWNKVALHIMEQEVPTHRLVESFQCGIVALCRVEESYIIKSQNPDIPMTLKDEPICECLGFGLVRATDKMNRLLHIISPLSVAELENVNTIIKGYIMIPDEIFLKQNIKNEMIPFLFSSNASLPPGMKSVPKRVFRPCRGHHKTP